MLKYYDYAVTMAEFPDEIALCVNITNCPGHCEKCSEPWLLENIGILLTNDEIDRLIEKEDGISLFGLMGGDIDHKDCIRIAKYIHEKYPALKVGMYSGQDYIDIELAEELDCYKIGRWIMPKGEQSEWHKTVCGPLSFPWSNQLYFERKDGKLINATYKFRQNKIYNLRNLIINEI